MRVVFDTNIYISALAIPGGNAEDAYLEAVHGTFELYTSVAILTETARVLQTKFDWAEDKVREAVREISQIATVSRPRPTLHILDDEPDNRILGLCDRRTSRVRRLGRSPSLGTQAPCRHHHDLLSRLSHEAAQVAPAPLSLQTRRPAPISQ